MSDKEDNIDITDEQFAWLKNNVRLLGQMTTGALSASALTERELCKKLFGKMDMGLMGMDAAESLFVFKLINFNVDKLHKAISFYRKQADRTKYDLYEAKAFATLAMVTDLKIKFL